MRRKGDDQAPKEDGNSLVPSKHTRSVVVLPRQVPDETSRSLHTSQSLKTVVRRPTEAAALEYASPSDRRYLGQKVLLNLFFLLGIGSLYSPCALYLRLPKANRKTARESSKEERERAAIAGLPDFLRPEWAA